MESVSAWLCVVLVSVYGVHVLQAACPHQPAERTLRRWSDSVAWSAGAKPAAGSAVVISDDVLLDESPPELASVTVSAGGSLVFSPEGDFTLATKYLMLNGALHIGSEDCRFPAKARILLTGTKGDYNIEGFGEKFIGVARGATLELHGQNKLSWSKLTSTIPKLTAQTGLLYDKKDDPSISTSMRGLVSYVINGTTGDTVFAKSVTFMGSSYRVGLEPPQLIEALDNTGDGDVIILAVHKNAISDELDMGPIYDAVERAMYGEVTNTGKIRQIGEYDAWAAIAVKGQFVNEELTTRLNADKRNIAAVTAIVSLAGQDVVVSAVSNTKPSYYNGGVTNVRFTTLEAGARILRLSHDATSWVPGDKLLFTSTDYDWEQAEVGEVTYCSPQDCDNDEVKVLMVNEYMHYGEVTEGVDERGEVALLNRNIVIEGKMEDACVSENGNCGTYFQDTFGGHIRIEEGFTNVHIQGVSLHHMGQAMYPDRPPVFFRQCGDVGTNGSYSNPAYVRSNSITESFSNCVMLSGTHSLTIADNVAWDHYSHCVYLKEGGEKMTVIDGNMVAGTRERHLANSLDRVPASFLITNPLTYFRNNVAAGGYRRGVWYVFPEEPVGESAGKGIMQPQEAKRTPLLEFNNNAIHSYGEMGIRFDHRLNAEGTNSYSTNNYQPKVDPLDPDSDNKAAIFHRLTAYKNRRSNAWIRGGYIIVQDSSFADSAACVNLAGSSSEQYLENTVVVGESENIGEPTTWWDAENSVLYTLSRSFPYYWDLRYPMKGFVSFDGPHYLNNVWFQNFVANDNRTASAVSFLGNHAWGTSAVNEVSGLSFGFQDNPSSPGIRMYDGNSSAYGYGDKDGDLQTTLRDKDGSLTGVAGSTVVRNYPVFTTNRCYYRDNWNLAVCPHKYGKLEISANDAKGGKSQPILTRDDVSPSLGQEVPFQHYTKYPVILGDSHSYILHWPKFMPKVIHLTGKGFEKDFGLRFGLCVPRDAELEVYSYRPQWRPRLDTWRAVSSVDMLDRDNDEGDRYFWDKTNGIIFFKMINPRTRCDDFKEECKDGCPYIRVTLTSGNASDSDCRDRISSYSRTPISESGALTYQPLSATPLPDGMGAGELVPFETRPSVDGGYGGWTGWGLCSTTCGGGTQIRTRPCDSPLPQHDGRPCDGPREEVRVCGTTPCEIDGRLGDWTAWSSCQALPDNGHKGTQTRARDCADPTPQHNGIACTGVTEQLQACVAAIVA